jgi:hypothetical protein
MLYSACGLPLAYQLQYTPECPESVLEFLNQVSNECFAGDSCVFGLSYWQEISLFCDDDEWQGINCIAKGIA